MTRTVFINSDKASKEFIEHNTLVLKGHVNLATTVFPSGIEGTVLCALLISYFRSTIGFIH